jgi:hypothetical protein
LDLAYFRPYIQLKFELRQLNSKIFALLPKNIRLQNMRSGSLANSLLLITTVQSQIIGKAMNGISL